VKGDLSLWSARLKTSNAQPEALLKKQKDHKHNVTERDYTFHKAMSLPLVRIFVHILFSKSA